VTDAFQVRVDPPAIRDLARLDEKVRPAVAEFIFGALGAAPRRVGKPLAGEFDGTWSARRGEYRVLYEIDDEAMTVHVIRVDHRRSAYRRR
jgi:mRNA interferase RelE/StbE